MGGSFGGRQRNAPAAVYAAPGRRRWPKQFCRILSQSTLLGETINRVAYTVQPASTVFVVARDHEPFYRKDLANVRASHIVAQPVSRGTTAAVALALMRIDHLACPEPMSGSSGGSFVQDARPLRMALEQAYTMATNSPECLVLVGARATRPDTDYGWIQPGQVIVKDRMRGPKRLPIHGVRGFVEKPTADVAEALFLEGAWWNTFVVVGHIRAFMDILEKTVPEISQPIAEAGGTRLARDCRLLQSVLTHRPVNFLRDVLAARTERLAVVGPLEAGWTDLGEPQRVLAAMANRGLPRPNLRQIAS